MGFAYHIAKRIQLTGNATRIAIAGIAIGLCVMLLTVAIVVGFKQEIRQRLSDFGGHLQVLALTGNRSYERPAICVDDSLLSVIRNCPEVESIQPFITKPAILKTADEFLCVVVKSYDDTLAERGIILSETIARQLQLGMEDQAKLYFVKSDDPLSLETQEASVKVRTVSVAGTYQTHFNEYDSQIILAPSELLQNVGGWDEDMFSGISIKLKDFDRMQSGAEMLTDRIAYRQDRQGTALYVETIEQQYPQIFAWLDLLDTNVWVVLGLMLAVAAFTMISGLLIIILERTRMIGILKAQGATNGQLRQTFLLLAMRLTGKGLLWGNLVGLGLCFVQATWHPVTLDANSYYLEWVPIGINLWHILAINTGTLLITYLVLILPSAAISHISPAKVLQSE